MAKITKMQTAEPVALPTQIEASEKDYLNMILDQAKAAQAALNSYSGFLSQKYQLAEGDAVQPDGKIVRKA